MTDDALIAFFGIVSAACAKLAFCFSDNRCGGSPIAFPARQSYSEFIATRHMEVDMNFLIWIVVGGILGWLASIVMRTNAQQGLILNIVVGIVGALLGGWLLAPLFGTGTINQDDFSAGSLGVSLLGAIVLLGIVNLIRGRGLR
jgi:uncharacterized membrane protein YeaQ/YmgE (transglycosylase-associated protein family)